MSVAIYYRVSSADQSIESQRAECRNAATRFQRELYDDRPANEWPPVAEFSDVASVSRRGSKGRNASPGKLHRQERPGLGELINACERGDVLRVVCAEVSRLARDVEEGAALMRRFLRLGTPIYFVRGGYDTSDRHGLSGAMGELVSAEVEAMWISERTVAGMRATSRKVGRPSTVSAADLRTLVDLRDSGVSWTQIANRLGLARSTVRQAYARHKPQGKPGGKRAAANRS